MQREPRLPESVTGGGGKATKQKPNGTPMRPLGIANGRRKISLLVFLVLTGDKELPAERRRNRKDRQTSRVHEMSAKPLDPV